MMLFIHLTMTGRTDPVAPEAAQHQPKPARIEALLLGIGMVEMGRMSAVIRPEGWCVPAGMSQNMAERYGMRARSPLPFLKDWSEASTHVVAHDMPETDRAMRCWRTYCKGEPAWLRPRQQLIDTAALAGPLMGSEDGIPTLQDATAALCGQPMHGVDGVLNLYSALNERGLLRAA